MAKKYLHIYFGVQGSGKTLSAVKQLQVEAYNPTRLANCAKRILKYNSMGYHFSMPEHLAFCDFDCEIHHLGKAPTMSYLTNGFYLGLPNPNMRTQRLPPYFFAVLDEGNKYFNSRNKQIMPQWRSRFYELIRHWGGEIIICCQRPGLVDLNIRELTDYEEFLGCEFVKDLFGNIVLVKIKRRHFETCADVERYLSTNILPEDSKIETDIINCRLPANNIPAYYDSQFFENLFLQGFSDKDWDLIAARHICSTVNDVEKFCQVFDYRVPKNLYKDN